ncbi:hypothetical protein [Anaeromyxobacter sp. SG26]|uniref:hypothetical protein n=1 Tax=Anaeromyxobacter sp. SG26 TaxID=2925407 RepID=UPI001F5A75D5|nr:hypothetical protein [Anaeromyxobacter sp. SG26]
MATNNSGRRRYTPPASTGSYYCPDCDGTFATNEEPAVRDHELKHRRIENLKKEFGPIMTRDEMRAAEDAAACVLHRTVNERVTAALKVLEVHRHRHMRRVAKAGRQDLYCSAEEFVAAASLERIFPADVAAELRKQYGCLRRPEIAMTDWNYPP